MSNLAGFDLGDLVQVIQYGGNATHRGTQRHIRRGVQDTSLIYIYPNSSLQIMYDLPLFCGQFLAGRWANKIMCFEIGDGGVLGIFGRGNVSIDAFQGRVLGSHHKLILLSEVNWKMSNYDNLRSSMGTAQSKYFLDTSYDYLPKRSSQDYGRNTNFAYGNKNYDTNQYSATFDNYTSDRWKQEYKSKYDNYTPDSNSYLRSKKPENLRNTTSVLPSYYADRAEKDFFSPRRQPERDYYDRKGARTFYEGPSSIQSTKDTLPLGLDSRDKAKYLSPNKYEKGSSSNQATSPTLYSNSSSNAKYESKTKRIQDLLDKVNKISTQQQKSTSPTPLSPTSPTSPRQQTKTRQDIMQKYKKYFPTTSESSPEYLAKSYDPKPKPDSKLYGSTATSTDYQNKRYGDTATDYTLLADSKSGELFKKKKDYRDVKSPDKNNDKKIGGYTVPATTTTTTAGKKEETASYLRESKNPGKEKEVSKTTREKDEKKISPPTNKGLISPTSYSTSSGSSKFQTKVTIRDFQVGKSKGQGKFGQVFLARHKTTNSLYALKKIPKQVIKDHHMQDQLVLQIKLQYYMSHPNILKLYTFFQDYQNIYLVLEYMQQGTLFEHLKKRKEKMSEKEVSRRICEISHGIKYLHDLDIAHRDIKPENIVMSNGMAKLCDFGWSTRCTNRRKTYCGTFDYVAPEIFEGKEYDWCVDLWCLGVLTYELLTGKVPFYNISRKETMKKILSVDKQEISFSSDISWEARDFVECLIKKAPQERRRADQLLTHPFLEKYQEAEMSEIKF